MNRIIIFGSVLGIRFRISKSCGLKNNSEFRLKGR